MSDMLRSRTEIEAALKSAEEAFEGFSHMASLMSKGHAVDPEYFRAVEHRAVGHGAIVHILQWVLGLHDDQGIDRVIITELEPGLSLAKVLHGSAREELQ